MIIRRHSPSITSNISRFYRYALLPVYPFNILYLPNGFSNLWINTLSAFSRLPYRFANKWRHFTPRSRADGATLPAYFAPFVVALYRRWEQDLITFRPFST